MFAAVHESVSNPEADLTQRPAHISCIGQGSLFGYPLIADHPICRLLARIGMMPGTERVELGFRWEKVMRILAALTASIFILASGLAAFDCVRAQEKANPEAKLKAMGIDVTKYESRPVANYINGVQVGNLLFMSGVGPRNADGKVIIGKVGAELTTEQGYQAARLVGLVMLANVRQTLGRLDRVKRVVRVQGMVNATSDFKEQAKVVDGFSDLMVEVFGDQGRAARVAPGMGSLPFQVPVICEAIFEVE
ncbi:MAG: RidA family protein [Rhizomicrobium sp.]